MTKEEFSGHIWDIVNEPSAIDIDQLWADIEAERGVVVDWSKAPDWANGVCTHFTEEHKDNWSSQESRISYIPRPAPKYREMTREEKIEALDSLPSIKQIADEIIMYYGSYPENLSHDEMMEGPSLIAHKIHALMTGGKLIGPDQRSNP